MSNFFILFIKINTLQFYNFTCYVNNYIINSLNKPLFVQIHLNFQIYPKQS